MLQGEHSALLLTFIKLPFFIKTFVLSIFEWPLKAGFTVNKIIVQYSYTVNCILSSKTSLLHKHIFLGDCLNLSLLTANFVVC